jgi:hypothetical protein
MKKSFILIFTGIVLGILVTSLTFYFSTYKIYQNSLAMSVVDSVLVAHKIRNGDADVILKGFDDQIDARVVSADGILSGDDRLTALWYLKDYCILNGVKANENSTRIFDALPARPMTSCEKLGKCKVRPSALGK